MTPSMETAATATEKAPLLHALGLRKFYRRGPERVHALDDASIELFPGEVVALVGRSGSGKTTLLNVLCGWETPDSGNVRWRDNGGSGNMANVRWGDLAIVPQGLGLMEELSVWENVHLPLRLGRGTRLERQEEERRVGSLLRALGLDHLARRRPPEISIGEQQRTSVARALVLQPSLMLADEPTGHQDEGWMKGVLRVIRMAAGRGACCLIATHNTEVLSVADRVLTIRDGIVSTTT
jgi:putative ABC transport system ATP-binding protein